jgi:hypothetical protein
MILPEEKIKEILINKGVIDDDLYERSKEDSKRLGIPFYEILIQRRLLDLNYFYDIEPLEKEILVRFRIDGVLREIMRLPKNLQSFIDS